MKIKLVKRWIEGQIEEEDQLLEEIIIILGLIEEEMIKMQIIIKIL